MNKSVETIVNAYIEAYNVQALDADSNAINHISGEANPWHNAGAFFAIGSRCASSARALVNKLDRLNDAEEKLDRAMQIDPEGYLTKLEERVAKADAEVDNARMFYEVDTALYEVLLGEPFGGSKPQADYGSKWFSDKADAILNPKETAPKKSKVVDMKETLKARLAKAS